ncbi:hypothetical protein L2U69_05490 [Zavarzinia compransoris]|uniref:hypothetical protein n=1 Tax=Zavarzinia marina TaxID=2911065 RepID=UPI001F47EDFD|nr:hypothetical protein [Zavarzinia marina]MCF4165087.1 hypothetical protein [Zavarzinia marina]
MAQSIEFLAALTSRIQVHALDVPDFYGLFKYGVDQAQTTEGIVVIAGIVVGAWALLRLFR